MADAHSPELPARFLAERWFLANGLPTVLRPGSLVRGLLPRSAPALAFFAVMTTFSMVVVTVTGHHTISIDGTPTRTEWFVLALLVLVIPVAAVTGRAVSRIDDWHRRTVVALLSLAVSALGGIFGGPSVLIFVDLLVDAFIVALIFICTATGIGSVLGWAIRTTLAHLASIGSLLVSALPVLLLTVLVFFNSPVWTMVSTVHRGRLWLALSFLFALAVVFLMSNTFGRAKPILESGTEDPEHAEALTGTPFEHMPNRPRRVPLSRAERINVGFVLALSQIVQIMTVALVTGLIFCVFGLILISPELREAWTNGGPADGQIFGMTLPIPNALIQICMFLTALTFMYLAAKAVGDKEYRAQYVDPRLDELRLTLVARDRYRTATAAHKGTT